MEGQFEVGKVVRALLAAKAKGAVKYLAPNRIVRATLISNFRGHANIVVTIGRPNYLEQRFIKLCKRAGEPFPVRRIHLKPFPKRRR